MSPPLPAVQAGEAVAGVWQHPEATHRIMLQGQPLAYCLKRRPRRSIGLMVDERGLNVNAPRWVSLAQVEALLQHKAAWVLKSLQQAGESLERQAAQRLHWQDGMQLPYLGAPLRLRLSPPHRPAPAGGRLQTGHPEGALLWLDLGGPASAEALEQAATAWLKGQARRLFASRLDHFAPLLGVQWQRLQLSSARTRWGSASADGSIRLNWRLIHLAPELIDYVVVHELAHLHEMNHSPRFWAHVEQVLPDWAERRRRLGQAQLPA